MVDVDVLVAGGGPVGLTAALELRRHGVACRVIDKRPEPARRAKAVGIQPRTLELWAARGMLRPALDAATPLQGQLLYVDGELVARIELRLPPEVPYGFMALPQYETERLLAEQLARYGTGVQRGVELTGLDQDADGVTARLAGGGTVRGRYLVGADGAHSVVRKALGLAFTGDAFPEEYMLGDVEVEWSVPPGFGVRAIRHRPGEPDDLLVAIPLPGHKRYRLSMLVPPELSTTASGTEIAHGIEGGRAPELHHIQDVLDRLAPEPTKASNLRWSSVFRISHRIVDRYADGRVFVAGDAAHIHPPTGAQGMNTGIQDAINLGWKLALAVDGVESEGLLASYDAERRPVGEEVVGRTVRQARAGIGAGALDATTVLLREAQLLVGYPGSPIVGGAGGQPAPGERAPDARGLTRDGVAFPLRLFELLASRTHTLLLAAGAAEYARLDELAAAVAQRAHGRLVSYAILGLDVPADGLLLPVLRDASGEFGAHYGPGLTLIRPDGYVGYRGETLDGSGLLGHLGRVFAPA